MNNLVKTHIRCPDCRSSVMIFNTYSLQCKDCQSIFPIINGKPVLVRSDNELFPKLSFFSTETVRPSLLSKLFGKIIPSPSTNLSGKKMLDKLISLFHNFENVHILVIGSGSQKSDLTGLFSAYKNLDILYSDVNMNAEVDIYCDAHELPFVDQTFHAIIITAVLEHVLYPEKVIGEIHRVLKEDGIVYSEIPFMQQVHEGAYDFTRYTLSGHRLLFNHFEELAAGIVAGAGTSLVWAIEYFVSSFVKRAKYKTYMRLISRALFFYFKYFDYIFKNKLYAADGASGTFFLGKKSQSITSDAAIVNLHFKN